MYARNVDGQVLTFGVSGKLIMNGLVMYDRETESLWAQVIGQAVDGPFQGKKLPVLAALETTWERWVAGHPNTLALDKKGGYRSDSYTGYYSDSRLGILGQQFGYPRVPNKELVVGIMVDGRSKAYPFGELRQTPVVNDVFNGRHLLVTFDSSANTAVVFSPVVDGSRLTFVEAQGAKEFLIEDQETGTLWDSLTGEALEGPLAGPMLEQVGARYEFCFAWKDYRPNTELYDGGGGF